jgi:N-acetylglutamate synthase-like GNAT family acetyltransferase
MNLEKFNIYNSSSVESNLLAKSLYQKYFGRSTLGPDERFFFIESGDKVIGVVRLSIEQSSSQLRSMLVVPEYRNKGIGKRLLKEFESYLIGHNIKNTCCLPYAKLESFYGEIGFKKHDFADAPDFLQKRLTEYKNQNKDEIIFMLRP